jgi:hypothetical protein
MIFEFDEIIQGKPYPNLARHRAVPYTPEWRQFSQHNPFSEPPTLIEWLQDEGIEWNVSGPRIYLVAVSFFSFNINWFDLIPKDRLLDIQQKKLYFCLFYSEGDNPWRLREHLEMQCRDNDVPVEQLLVITANSMSDSIPHSAWFADDELLFRKRNRNIPAISYHERPREKLFTALVRTHKWWRATVMAGIRQRGWQELGYFSYNPYVYVGEPEDENPIEIDRWEGLRTAARYLAENKFSADTFTSDEHNDHHLCVNEHYDNSYLNIVIETHMDVDQSNGVFLTEKTFKPIKHAQPFVIFGAPHSLARLRDMGYRTFDNVIDPSYDNIENTTDRYAALMHTLEDMIGGGAPRMHEIYCACREDLIHNQRHFLASKADRLNTLLGKLICNE